MNYKIEIKLDEWIDLTEFPDQKISIDSPFIIFNFSTKKFLYMPDVFEFQVLEEEIDLIDKIRNHPNNVDVRVTKNNELFFYGYLQDRKRIIFDDNINYFNLEARDFVNNSLSIKNTVDWKFTNESLANIGKALCDFAGTQSFFPVSMQTKKIPFCFITSRDDTILKILNRFLYEYGYVLQAKYFGGTPVVSANSYRDREDTVSTTITDQDFTGNVGLLAGEEKEAKLFYANYRIIKHLKNRVLWVAGLGGIDDIPVPAGKTWPGDETVTQYQEFNLINRDLFDRTRFQFDPNNDLDWGTISKKSEIIWSSNHRTSWWHHVGGDPFIQTEEYYPTKAKVLWGNRVTRRYTGEVYRVIGQRAIRKIPEGCSERITESKVTRYRVAGDRKSGDTYYTCANYNRATNRFVALVKRYRLGATYNSRAAAIAGSTYFETIITNPIRVLQYRSRGNCNIPHPNFPSGVPIPAVKIPVYTPIVNSQTFDRPDVVELHNSSLGYWEPKTYLRTTNFYDNKLDAESAAELIGARRKCSGREERVYEPIFETATRQRVGDTALIRDLTISGDAYVSIGQGAAYAAVFNERSREYTINQIKTGDSTDSLGNAIKILGYQFVDTPTFSGILNPNPLPKEDGSFNGWHMLTENSTLVKISNYIGDTTPPLDRWGFPSHPQQREGVVEFAWEEDLFPARFVDNPTTQPDPIPLFDKRGTKAIFLPPGEVIEKKKIETSFIYTHDDASDFVQGILNNVTVDNTVFSYRGYISGRFGEKKHPGIGEYIDLRVPDIKVNNERFIVTQYIIHLDEENNPTAEITLRKTKRWVPEKKYPDLQEFFPDLPAEHFNPSPVEDRLYIYTDSAGVHPLARPDPNWPFRLPQVVRGQSWRINQSEYDNRWNRRKTTQIE